ncbi:MAG: hypothetical protein ABI409_03415 [Ramlibacter sp.]
MRIDLRIPLLVVLAAAGLSHGQQRPGLAAQKPGPQDTAAQAPGEQDGGAQACQAELARLRTLVADQRSYIALLEQKVQSLQPPTATGKGKTP